MTNHQNSTIVAPITGQAQAAVSVIRISGPEAISISESLTKKKLQQADGYTLHYGFVYDGEDKLDEVVIALFKAPKSYTGEDVVEISFHASPYILSRALDLCQQNGAKMAQAGEFSMRAYLNGQLDLSQAEAVADLIASSSKAAHDMAMYQLKGAYSTMIQELRARLIKFAALLELELDFAEEDVEFADRTEFVQLIDEINQTCKNLSDSFKAGNVIKKGIPVAIIGAPNAGKSTLLNALLKENRAIVSDIAGTTRDTIEDEMQIGGHTFRFIDTAGIRETEDQIEKLGIERSYESLEKAKIILWMHDLVDPLKDADFKVFQEKVKAKMQPDAKLVLLANKHDKVQELPAYLLTPIKLAAKAGGGVEEVETQLAEYAKSLYANADEMVISNARHFEAMQDCINCLSRAKEGLQNGLSTDLVAFDVREALQALGSITGEITTDDLLGTIFSEFCIGK